MDYDYIKAQDLKSGDEFMTKEEADDWQQHGSQPGVFTVVSAVVRQHTTKVKVDYREPGIFATDVKVYDNNFELIKL